MHNMLSQKEIDNSTPMYKGTKVRYAMSEHQTAELIQQGWSKDEPKASVEKKNTVSNDKVVKPEVKEEDDTNTITANLKSKRSN